MGQLRTMQSCQVTSPVVTEDPPGRANVRLVGGCIFRDDGPGPSGAAGSESRRRAASPLAQRATEDKKGSGGPTPAPSPSSPATEAELRAAVNPPNIVCRPNAWLEWRVRHGFLEGVPDSACLSRERWFYLRAWAGKAANPDRELVCAPYEERRSYRRARGRGSARSRDELLAFPTGERWSYHRARVGGATAPGP